MPTLTDLTNKTTAETNVYFDVITGLWFAEIGVWFGSEYVMGITRGGYTSQSSAKAQKTRLYNMRHSIVVNFSNSFQAQTDADNGQVVAIGKVDLWKRDNGQYAIRYACDTRTEYSTDFSEIYDRAVYLSDIQYGTL